MGFNKRYISKDVLLNNMSDINSLFNTDAIILDNWSSYFIKNMNKDQGNLIKALEEKYGGHSTHMHMMKDVDFIKIESYSEILISLFNEVGWLPIVWTLQKLKPKLTDEEVGRYFILLEKCKKLIIKHIDVMSK